MNCAVAKPGPEEMRHAMRSLATGVVVVTVATGNARRGMTANSLTSISLSPPLLSICMDLRSTTYRMIAEAEHFAISILSDTQQAVSAAFAQRQTDGFDPFTIGGWKTGSLGDPVLEGALGSMEMKVESVHTWADHAMIIARVAEIWQEGAPQKPLIFFGGSYTSVLTSLSD